MKYPSAGGVDGRDRSLDQNLALPLPAAGESLHLWTLWSLLVNGDGRNTLQQVIGWVGRLHLENSYFFFPKITFHKVFLIKVVGIINHPGVLKFISV